MVDAHESPDAASAAASSGPASVPDSHRMTDAHLAVAHDPVEHEPGTDATTRDRVLADVLLLGPVTAVTLSQRLDLTPTAVRRHLEFLTDSGDIAPSDTSSSHRIGRRGRGRPARAYVVTPAGHRRLRSDDTDIAVEALCFLARHSGEEAVEAFARERFEDLEERYGPRVEAAGDDPTRRAEALAQALASDGFAASTRPVGIDTPLEGVQLCQGHCPMQAVAAEFPQFCEAETDAFARLLGVHVQRLATLAGGEHVCTTYVPGSGSSAPPGASPGAEADRARRPDRPTAPPSHEAPAPPQTPLCTDSEERTPR